MLRVVLAVVLSVALLGVAMPVVEDARAERTSSLAEGELARLAERATGLAATEEPGPGGDPRRIVDLSLPESGIAAAPIDFLAVGGVPVERSEPGTRRTDSPGDGSRCVAPPDTPHGDVVAYRLEGGDTHVRQVPVDVRVVTDGRVRDDGEPLVLRGDARLTLSLVDRDGESTVLVHRGDTGDRPIDGVEPGDPRA